MGNITQILALKGNKPFLNFDDRFAIEGGGTYKDYEYLIFLTNLGIRCGYIALPFEHQLNNDELSINCHGEIVFFEAYHPAHEILEESLDEDWIGFHCGLSTDCRDWAACKEYFKDKKQIVIGEKLFPNLEGTNENRSLKDFYFVEEQCKSIIDQLISRLG